MKVTPATELDAITSLTPRASFFQTVYKVT